MQINVTDEVVLDNLYVDIVMGRNLFEQILDRFGKAGWNAYTRKLRQHNIWAMYSTPEPTDETDHCMPVCVTFDWRGLSFSKSDLSGLDLAIPEMADCNFSGANLSRSQIGCVTGSTFRDANLRDAIFDGDISGCDFSGANMIGTSFNEAWYHRSLPPISLPEAELARCHKFPEYWEVDEKPEDRPRHPVAVKSVELRSFWGELK